MAKNNYLNKLWDCIVVGMGPAGYSAGIYATRYNMSVLLIGDYQGGMIEDVSHIENYPGFTKISGNELAERMKEQYVSLGGSVYENTIADVEKIKKEFVLTTVNNKKLKAKTVIIATGTKRRKLNIEGEDKFNGRGVSYCATCLPPTELVVVDGAIKQIKDVSLEDKVLTNDGSFQKISKKTVRKYSGNLVEVKTRFFTEPVYLTENHPVLKQNVIKGTGANYKPFKFTKPEWIEAGYVKKNDLLMYPVPKTRKDKKHILISDIIKGIKVDSKEYVMNNFETHSAKRLPNKIHINEDFMRLAGYFISEGCATDRGLNIYFNKKELKYISDTVNLIEKFFKIKPVTKIVQSVCRINVYSRLMGQLFEILFGKYAHNKKLPSWALSLPLNKQKEIIKGIWRGDGCTRDKDFCIVTNSRTLAYQIRDILLRLEILPSVQKRALEKLKSTLIDGRIVSFRHDKYHIIVGGPSLKKMAEILEVNHKRINERTHSNYHAFLKDGFVLLPIKNIKQKKYVGEVYNLAVVKNNSYVAKNIITHNCDAPFFKNKIVAVVGGGDSAFGAALHLSQFASKVYLIHRRKEFRAQPANIDAVKKQKNVEFILESVVTKIEGQLKVSNIVLQNANNGKEKKLVVDGVFIEAGLLPTTNMVSKLNLKKENDYIVVEKDMSTNIEGLFAVGDCTNSMNEMKQIATAVAGGAIAAESAYKLVNNAK